jgi:molybdopterin/thiamine biosynthesis adenylyltransferase
MQDNSYKELVSRNWGFLNTKDQTKVKEARILLAGCGLGSNIATLASRTGFTKFILADGDTVEISNLNRQSFRMDQTGRNKAEATADLIKEINPKAEIEILPHFITEQEVPHLVSKTRFIVNTVDPDPVIFALNGAAQCQNKMALFPLNIGFGGLVLVFSRYSMTLEEMLERKVTKEELFIRLLERITRYIPYLSSYIDKFSETIDDILRGVRPGPQLGIAANISASLAVTAMVRGVLGEPLKLAPEPVAFDTWFDCDKL